LRGYEISSWGRGKQHISFNESEEDLNMKLVVLGSNGGRPTDLGQTACYAIPELGAILDAGTGMYRMFDYLQTEYLDVYLSHDHPDHVWGLTYLESIFWKRMTLDAIARAGRANGVSIFKSLYESPRRVRVHVAQEHLENVQYQVRKFREHNLIEYVPMEAAEDLPDSIKITSFPVENRKHLCLGFGVDLPGGSLAYVTDAYGEPGVRYAEKIQGVDVLLHDCSCPDDDPKWARQIDHSHITPVAQLAAEAKVGRLVLIHLSRLRPETGEPEIERALSIFPRTEVAFDRMEIEF
jgi:ribonuclease Z